MHVAFLIDERRLANERDWFNRTVIGLATSGIHVTRVLPQGALDDERVALTPAVWYQVDRVPWMRSRLYAALAKSFGSDAPDLIHAAGRKSWPVAVQLGAILECPVAIEVWSAADVRAAAGLARRQERVSVCLAATGRLAADLQAHMDPALVQVLPVGVHLEEVRPVPQPSMSLRGAAVVYGRGCSAAGIRDLLEGLAPTVVKHPDLMLFLDIPEAIHRVAWRAIRKFGLSAQTSMIPSIDRHRELVATAEMLIIPEAGQRATSFVLEAMAAPMMTLARRDPYVDILNDDRCATLVEGGGALEWNAAIRAVLDDPQGAWQKAIAARAFVENRHIMIAQLTLLMETYERVLRGDAIPWAAAASEPGP